MIAKIMFYKNDGQTAKGYPVKLVLSVGKKTRRKTVGFANMQNWDLLKNRPAPGHPDFEYLFGLCLDVEKNNMKANFREMENFEMAFAVLLQSYESGSVTISEYFDIEIERLQKNQRFGTADNYAFIKKELNLFAPGTKLAAVDTDFVMRWKYAKRETVNDNTLRTYLGRFRSLYNKAVEDPSVDLTDKRPFRYAMKDLHVRTRRKKQRYLDDENLQKFIALEREPLSGPQMQAVRLSLLQFYFCGLNLKDLYYLKKSDFYKDRVLLSRAKLGKFKEEFDVKVIPAAAEILEKMKGSDPIYLFPWSKDHKKYLNFIALHNKRLWYLQKKYDLQLAPKDQLLNTNTFRHTFATRAKFLNIEEDIIRELMGHERNDVDTAYKDKYPENVRDQAHLEIITLEFQRYKGKE